MLFKRSAVGLAAWVCLAVGASSASAQQVLERVEVTGTSIKRIASEGSLPVQIVTAEQIRSSGATNVQDLIQHLPAMQGFTIADTAIGTNSGGYSTASLHDLGSSYTLVLVNGRRIAPIGDGNVVNLNAIPMSAIERVEVLTDGASALYGSDAIAGVINFILKKNYQGGNVTVQGNRPMGGAGRSANASITYGFGDLDTDRFNILATYRHDDSGRMKSGDRNFAAHAFIPFSYGGNNYMYDRTSTYADPANAQVVFKKIGDDKTALKAYSFNPYLKANGACASNNIYSLSNTIAAGSNGTAGTAQCAFDYVSTIDIYPEFKRDAFFTSGHARLGEHFTAFSDFAYTRYNLIARTAPNPVPIDVPVGSALYKQYVLPGLTADQQARVSSATASYRATDFGTRDDQTLTRATHFVVGVQGDIGKWDVESALTWSRNALNEQYVGGYFKAAEFNDLINSGQLDPFVPSGHQSAATQQLIRDSIFHGSIRTASTTLTGIDARGTTELATLPGGPLSLGLGADLRSYHYVQTPSDDALNDVIYNFAPNTPYDLKRGNFGAYVELAAPVLKSLELDVALRHDRVGTIKDAVNHQDFGQQLSATTYKLSGRYQAAKQVLLRGSYGTGFKAPDMLDIAQPLVSSGVTSVQYDCPFPGDGSGSPPCKPGKAQYSVLSGGNAKLKPERSKQATFGVRVEPSSSFSIAVDYWQVKMKDAVSGVSATQAFGDPAKYASLFTTYHQPAETSDFYAFEALSTNIGKTVNKGLDWEAEGRIKVPDLGLLTTSIGGTYMIKSSYTRPGTSDDFTDSMGHYGENAAVTFRNIFQASAKLESGPVTNTFTMHWRSAYKDINQTVRDLQTNLNTKVSLDVPAYMTVDYQGLYKYSAALEFRLGIKNLTNEAPPLTLRDSSGHQVGYDPRYASPMMRTLYMMGSYTF